jgi:uncharacterized protein (DUF305 family)
MLLFIRSRFCLSSVAAAAGLIATATALAADPAEVPSLAEYITAICSAAFHSATPEEAPFLSENVGAMTRMMVGMEITPSGDVDTDFAAMMIPHHQGAIDMAQAELRHGHNEQLRRIAQEIIVTQQQEIAAMRLALGQPLPPSDAAPDQPSDLSAGAPQPTPTPQ